MGKPITESYCSSPINVVGFDTVPPVGCIFEVFDNKKDAEKAVQANKEAKQNSSRLGDKTSDFSVPLIIKADTVGSIEAIEKEVLKLNNAENGFRIIKSAVGNVSENDIKTANGDKDTIIVGFHVNIDRKAEDVRDQMNVTVMIFDIIYKLTEWLEEELEKRRPRKEVNVTNGVVKILKCFNQTKDKQVIGCRVESGSIKLGSFVKILRRDNEISTGKITELQHNKSKTKEVFEGDECGAQIETKITLAPGDVLESITKEIQ